ncbi:hypothetical protein ACLMNJ_24325 [Streptomyces seoulensis]
MSDGIAWVAEGQPLPGGYCLILARDLTPEDLVRRLVPDTQPRPVGPRTQEAFEDELRELSRATGRTYPMAGVRYGSVGDLAFAVGCGQWEFALGRHDTPAIWEGDVHTYELYYFAEHPNVPEPHFRYGHEGRVRLSSDIDTEEAPYLFDVDGDDADLVADMKKAAEVTPALPLLERRFGLTLPKELILTGELPAAVVKSPQ